MNSRSVRIRGASSASENPILERCTRNSGNHNTIHLWLSTSRAELNFPDNFSFSFSVCDLTLSLSICFQ